MKKLHPGNWPRPRGFSNGVAAEGRVIFVAGQVGWNAETQMFEAKTFSGQVRHALRNIVTVLKEAGAGPEHITQMTWYVTDLAAYRSAGREIGEAYRELIGRHYPAMTMVQVVALLDDQAQVEIEATAVVPNAV